MPPKPINRGNAFSWGAEPVQAPSKRKKAILDVIHPKLEAMASTVSDPFWAQKLHLAALGDFPCYFSLQNSETDTVLIFRKGAKTLDEHLSPDIVTAAEQWINFVRLHSGLISPEEQKKQQELQENSKKPMEVRPPITWETANKKVQEALIYKFIRDKKVEKSLNQGEEENLKYVLREGIESRHFGKTNIMIVENRISEVKGLLFDPERREFSIDPTIQPAPSRNYTKTKGEMEPGMVEDRDERSRYNETWTKLKLTLKRKEDEIKNVNLKKIRYEKKGSTSTTRRSFREELDPYDDTDDLMDPVSLDPIGTD